MSFPGDGILSGEGSRLALDGGTPVRKADDFLVFGAPLIEEDEIDEVVECLRSRWIGTGPRAHRFEEEFAAYKGKKYAIALNSCTAALHLSMLSSGIGPGDEVITTPMRAFHLYTPLIDVDRLGKSRDWVLNALNAENIGTGVHYMPVHYHPYYRKTFGWRKGDYPNSEWIGERTISLPLSPALTDRDVGHVVEAFTKVLRPSR